MLSLDLVLLSLNDFICSVNNSCCCQQNESSSVVETKYYIYTVQSCKKWVFFIRKLLELVHVSREEFWKMKQMCENCFWESKWLLYSLCEFAKHIWHKLRRFFTWTTQNWLFKILKFDFYHAFSFVIDYETNMQRRIIAF